MKDIIWKSFKMSDLFERSTKLALSINQKDLNLSEVKDDEHRVALISASRNGSGRVGYVSNELLDENTISKNKITFDDQWGYTFFQKEEFVITGGHNAILEIIDSNFKNLLDNNLVVYSYLSLIINKVTIKSEIFGYGFKINNKLDREIIILPCLELTDGKDFIWENDGHYYTLAVDYIKELMDKAKELREQKTIRLYEAERAKYEAERAKYEAEYLKEKEKVIWKALGLGKFLDFSAKHVIKDQIKTLHIYEEYENGRIANVTASKENNGIVGYIDENEEIRNKKVKNVLTIAPDAAYAGMCFYQKDNVVSTGHNKVIEIVNDKMKELFNNNTILYQFLASIITKNFCKTFYGFSKSIVDSDFKKTLLLLPCIEVAGKEESVWEENGHYYTLATNYISYLYLTGRVNANQKLIDNYTYQY